MRINYMDPGLWRPTGHHFHWFLQIAGRLASEGHTLRAYVHQDVLAPAREAMARHAEVVPLFAHKPYANPQRVDPICGELSLFIADYASLPLALGQAAAADAWLWPTLFASHLAALATARIQVPIAACIHYGPGLSPQLGAQAWRFAARSARQARLQLRLSVTADELAPLYRPLLGRTPHVLPIPVDAGPRAPAAERIRTVGFFGAQAGEKGVMLLPRLLPGLLARGLRVIVHDSAGTVGPLQYHPDIERLGYVENLADEIARCDLVVMPYDPAKYRHAASSIAWEALSRGVPLIAPKGTLPGNLTESSGAGKTFATFDAAGVLAAVDDARADYPAVLEAARRAHAQWPLRHGLQPHLETLLGQVVPLRTASP